MRLWPFTSANDADGASTAKASSWASYLTLSNLPSLPNLSLPSIQSLQQSLFRYVVNRTLGRYVDLDAVEDGSRGRLKAEFARGQVLLTQVKLKVKTINEALTASLDDLQHSKLDIEVLSGSLRKAEIILGLPTAYETANDDQVASEPTLVEKLLSAPISVWAEGIEVDILLRPRRCHSTGQPLNPSVKEPVYGYEEETGFNTLEKSILDLAADFVQEGSGNMTAASADELEDYLPGAFVQDTGTIQQGSVSAGLIAQILERLLLRLSVTVRSAVVNIYVACSLADQIPSEQTQDMLRFEASFTQLVTNSRMDQSIPESPSSRQFALSGFQISMQAPSGANPVTHVGRRPPQSQPQKADLSRYRREYSEDDLAMSMAVADLRESVDTIGPHAISAGHTDSQSSNGSMGSEEDLFHSIAEPFPTELSNQRSQSDSPHCNTKSSVMCDDNNAGAKAVDCILMPILWFTTDTAPAVSMTLSASPTLPGEIDPSMQKTILDLLVEITAVQIRLNLPQFNCLSQYSEAFAHLHQHEAASTSTVDSNTTAQFGPNMHIKLAAIKAQIDLPHSAEISSDVKVPQLMAEAVQLEAVIRPSAALAKVSLHTFGVWMANGTSTKHSCFPIILPDPYLAWVYSAKRVTPGHVVEHTGDWSAVQSRSQTLEWQSVVAMPTEVLPSAKSIPILQDAIAIRRSAQNTKVTLQPLHIWVDTEVLQELAIAVSMLRMPQRDSKASSESGSAVDASAFVVQTACVRVDVRCTPTQISSNIRSSVIGCDLVGLCAETLPNKWQDHSTSSNAGTVHYSLSACNLFYVEKGSVGSTACMLHSCTRVLASISGLTSTLVPHPDVQASSATLQLDKASLDMVQYFIDDLGHQATHISQLCSSSAETSHLTSGTAMPLAAREAAHADNHASRADEQPAVGILKSGGRNETVFSLEIPKVTMTMMLKDTSPVPDRLIVSIANLKAVTEVSSSGQDNTNRLTVSGGIRAQTQLDSEVTTLLAPNCDVEDVNLRLVVLSSVDPITLLKSSAISLDAIGLTLSAVSDVKWLRPLMDVLKTPPGAFADMKPSDKTYFNVSLADCYLGISALADNGIVALHLKQIDCNSTLSSRCGSHGNVDVGQVTVRLNDHSGADPSRSTKASRWARLASMHSGRIIWTAASEMAPSVCEVDNLRVAIMLCADTLPVLSRFATSLQTLSAPIPLSIMTDFATDLSTSIMTDFATDLSTSIMLDEMPASAAMEPATVLMDTDVVPRAIYSGSSELFSIYGSGPIQILPGYLQVPLMNNRAGTVPLMHRRMVVDIKSPLITIALHEGYDFEASRKSVQTKVKRTRQKLERIKRLLQEGQTPAETMEEAAGDMMRSIFLPSMAHQTNNVSSDAYERIVAFDDELAAVDDDPASTSASMSTLSRAVPSVPPKAIAMQGPVPNRIKRLKRHKEPIIVSRLYSTRFGLVMNSESADVAWKVRIDLGNIEVVDNFIGSTWNMILIELRPSDGGVLRPTGSPMAKLRLQSVRGLPSSALQEMVLKAQIAPLRLHVDQDVLDFLKAFSAFGPVHMPAVPAEPVVQDTGSGFVRHFEVLPIKIKLDYKPRRVDYHALRQGRTIEMMNFFHFVGSEMVLRHVVLKGVPSLAEAGEMLQDLWTPDVKANQLSDFLAGINPVRSVVNVGSGFADLVLLPPAHYSKDGRFMRGVHLGSRSFAKATALEAAKVGARLAAGTQVILEHAERALGGVVPGQRMATTYDSPDDSQLSHSVVLEAEESNDEDDSVDNIVPPAFSKYATPPSNAQAGVSQAYRQLSSNLKSAAQTILAVPIEIHEANTQGGTRAVIKAVPIAVLKPMIGATGAVSSALLGLQSSLDPSLRMTTEDKYKRHNNSKKSSR